MQWWVQVWPSPAFLDYSIAFSLEVTLEIDSFKGRGRLESTVSSQELRHKCEASGWHSRLDGLPQKDTVYACAMCSHVEYFRTQACFSTGLLIESFPANLFGPGLLAIFAIGTVFQVGDDFP